MHPESNRSSLSCLVNLAQRKKNATMGLGSYFKTKKPEPQAAVIAEKPTMAMPPPISPELLLPVRRLGSSRNSMSNRSTQSSTFLDDIKHEVMVNYLYQQQCSQLWVSDGSGEVEGVLLRKSKNVYMTCPPQLGNSPFAAACAALNVQVKTPSQAGYSSPQLTITPVCYDSQFESHQDFPAVVS